MTQDQKITIYHKTDGYCHLCHKKLAFKNHGKHYERGAWHVEHSRAQAKGGTHHMNNLYAACISCNLEKGILHTRTIRRRNNVTKAPLSKAKKLQVRSENSITGGIVGFVAGLILGRTPLAIAVCTALGAKIGNDKSVKG